MSRALNVSLLGKFLLIITGVVVFCGATLILFVQTEVREKLTVETRKRGLALAKDTSFRVADSILSGDFRTTHLNIKELLDENNQDVEYIFVLDRNRKVIAHTFGDLFPVDLINVNRLSKGASHGSRTLVAESKTILDLVVPTLHSSLGEIHVGMKDEVINKEVQDATTHFTLIILLVLFIASGVAWFFSLKVTQPLTILNDAANAIRDGNLDHRLELHTGDEIEAVANSFNAMADGLKKKSELLSHQLQLNTSLAELSEKMLTQASIEEISELVLKCARAFTRSPLGMAGYIDQESGDLLVPTLTGNVSTECRMNDKDAVFKDFRGLWGWVLKNRKALLTNQPGSDPRSCGIPDGHVAIHRYLSVPVVSEGRLIGQLSVANSDGDYSENDQHVLERFASLFCLAILRQQTERELKRYRDSLEEQVQERTAQLAATNKELEAFAYSVSHDLRAPLRRINGFSLVLLEEYGESLDDIGRDYLQRVRNGCVSMGTLIDDLLQLSRLARADIHREKIDISDLVQSVANELQEVSREREVEVLVDSDLRCNADPALLRIAMTNLLGNAWKFTRKTENPRIEFGVSEEDGQLVYFVKDNGAGFDMQYADMLFRSFQRLHHNDDFEGNGIGLATVQRIINRHGGLVWAEGTVGSGAAFYFTLEGDRQ